MPQSLENQKSISTLPIGLFARADDSSTAGATDCSSFGVLTRECM